MTSQEFMGWLSSNNACPSFLCDMRYHPEELRSSDNVWGTWPRGYDLLWWHEKAGTSQAELRPVVARLARRAVRTYAPSSLRSVGLDKHAESIEEMLDFTDKTTLTVARATVLRAAWVAWEKHWSTEDSSLRDKFWSAYMVSKETSTVVCMDGVASGLARLVSEIARRAHEITRRTGASSFEVEDAENLLCAEDCRELLEMPNMTGFANG